MAPENRNANGNPSPNRSLESGFSNEPSVGPSHGPSHGSSNNSGHSSGSGSGNSYSSTAIQDPRPPKLSEAPSPEGRYGAFGGVYVPETLVPALKQLEEEYLQLDRDREFWTQLAELHRTFVGRPTPLYLAQRLTDMVRSSLSRSRGGTGQTNSQTNGQTNGPIEAKGAKIWLKREDLAHTGAHKINNTLGQALLAIRMGKTRLIAETGAGQHGVATATVAAHFGLSCDVYMGTEDIRRQRLNVTRMRMLGARVVEVDSGSRTLKDATNEAMRDWQQSVQNTHYIIGSVVGPHPFPMIVRDFQSVIGRETKAQSLRAFGRLPDAVVACVGGGSNAAGIFYHFVEDTKVVLIGVEAGGKGSNPGDHAAPLSFGTPGVLHGSLSYVLQDGDGQTMSAHSCSAGLDYPGVGPEHSYWKDAKRVTYTHVSNDQALDAFEELARQEGIIPALETAHAISYAIHLAGTMPADTNIVVNLSGRGDKDVDEASRLLELRKKK